MIHLRQKLKDHQGSMFPLVVVFFLAVMLMSSWVYEYLKCFTLATEIKTALERATVSAAAANNEDIYNDLRVAYSIAAARGEDPAWNTKYSLDGDLISCEICRALGASQNDNGCTLYDRDGEPVYALEHISGSVSLSGFEETVDGEILFRAASQATVTLYLGGPMSHGDPIALHMKTDADWTPLF